MKWFLIILAIVIGFAIYNGYMGGARDAAQMLEIVVKEPKYRALAHALANNLRNHRIPALLPDDLRVVHKTGSLKGVVNDAGTIMRRNGPLTLAFLCDNEPDSFNHVPWLSLNWRI